MRVLILVEGQTEETFVKEMLAPYLQHHEIFITPVIVQTKKTREGRKFKGGLSNGNLSKFFIDLRNIIHSCNDGLATTFIDYYAIPTDFPGYEERLAKGTPLEKVEYLENKLFEYMGSPSNFLPYIQLHEFEAFHFADETGFRSNLEPDEADIEGLVEIINRYDNPEDINEGKETHPSARIIDKYPAYEKEAEGNIILLDIGIEKLLEKCPHFRQFVEKIISFKNNIS